MEFVSSVKMDILFIRIDVFRIAHLDSMLIITIHVRNVVSNVFHVSLVMNVFHVQ